MALKRIRYSVAFLIMCIASQILQMNIGWYDEQYVAESVSIIAAQLFLLFGFAWEFFNTGDIHDQFAEPEDLEESTPTEPDEPAAPATEAAVEAATDVDADADAGAETRAAEETGSGGGGGAGVSDTAPAAAAEAADDNDEEAAAKAAATVEFLTSLMEYGDDATIARVRALFQDADDGDWLDLTAPMSDEQQAFLDKYD